MFTAPVQGHGQWARAIVAAKLATVLMGSAVSAQPALLADPDTSAEIKQVPEVGEPRRAPHSLARRQRIVSIRYALAQEGIDHFRSSLPELVTFANKETHFDDIRFVAEEAVLADPKLGKPLLLLLTGNRATLAFNAREKLWLGGYLTDGGLLYAEDVRGPEQSFTGVAREGTPFDRQLKALLADGRVLGDAGRKWQRVDHDHPIYRAFFEFPGGPPLATTTGGRRSDDRVTDLEMLELRGRVVAVFSDLNISYGWASTEISGRHRALQFGTNLLVFALAERRAGPIR